MKKYQEYQLEWMLDHGYSLADLIKLEDELEVRPFELGDIANHLDDIKKLDEMSGFNFARSAEGFWNEWNNFLWGCFYQGKAIGYCAIGQAISYFDEEDSPEIWDYPDLGYGTSLAIFQLYINPEYRDKIIGTEFVKRAIEMRRKDEAQIGHDLVRYFVEVENEQQKHFFEKLGFKPLPSKNSKCLGMVLEPELENK